MGLRDLSKYLAEEAPALIDLAPHETIRGITMMVHYLREELSQASREDCEAVEEVLEENAITFKDFDCVPVEKWWIILGCHDYLREVRGA